MHDPLGPAGGARGEQHPQRVAERHRLRYQVSRTRGARPAEPSGCGVRGEAEPGKHDRRAQGGQQRGQLADVPAPVECPPAVPVSVGRDEHHRLQLPQAVGRRRRRVVLAAAGPDGAEARRGQEGDDRLGRVRHVPRDPVPGTDSQIAQQRGQVAGLLAQHPPRQQAADRSFSRLPGFPGVDQRDPVRVASPEHLLDVADPRSGEPLDVRHDRPGQHPLVRRLRADAEVVPDGGPELLEPVHRPPPQLQVVAGQLGPPAPGEPAGKAGHVGRRDVAGVRNPDRLAARAHFLTAPAAGSSGRRPARSGARPGPRWCSPASCRAGGTPAAAVPCPPPAGFR